MNPSRNKDTASAYPSVDPFENERRFLLTRAQVVRFLKEIAPQAVLELYDRARPLSFTRTTYLDTDDLAYLRSCEGPVARRLRVREYAVAANLDDAPVLSGVCFLELKQSAGTARSKIRLSAPAALIERIIERRLGDQTEGAEWAKDLGAPGIDQLAALRALDQELAQAPVAPRLSTWYRRTCLTAESGRVRITLDEGLTYCRPHGLGAPGQPVNPGEVVGFGPPHILEIKYWGGRPAWLSRATRDLAPAHDFSKFRMGMKALERPDGAVCAAAGGPQGLSPALAFSILSGDST